MFLDSLHIFQFAAERSATRSYNKLLPEQKGFYQVVDVGEHNA